MEWRGVEWRGVGGVSISCCHYHHDDVSNQKNGLRSGEVVRGEVGGVE